jgi:DnaJ-domain-containing protein 1
MKNPLKRAILEILQNAHGPIKEYELHETLGGQEFEEFVLGCSEDLRLFRQHFLVMNALYELHHELLTENIFLHISALDIHIKEIPTPTRNSDKNELSADLFVSDGFYKLSDYYLNWQNFKQTNDEEVEKLLTNFWNQYLFYNEKDTALACLELNNPSSWSEIKQQYRQLCQQHHPDKGGDNLYFLKIRQAYDNLKQLYLNS